jgi:4-amino-4-deoxy-L-arabinose transferase-like glycosyltransferase
VSAPAHALPRPARTRRLGAVRAGTADPRWVRPALAAVLVVSAVLCLWHLTISGYSNDYYAAAVKAASESWKAWFFGSLDPGSFITVDKPPLSLWLMGLSVRVLGFSSFAMLLPQALCTIAAVGLLYATVRRLFGPAAGIAAAAALALTPVTVAIGRVNNPDALLVLLMVAAAYLVMRALESGRTKHLAWCGAVVGLAFMTKMLQGWMLVPALGLVYLVAGPPRLASRIRQLAVAGVVMVAVSAAWPLAVTLWPGSTPYIGGSTDGSVWDLILGYNGFGRIFGEGAGPGGGGGGGGMFGGAPGLWRMFNAQVGGQIAWLLPLAGVSLVAGLWLTRRAPRTDARRAGWLLFGAWALVHVAIFSTQRGIFHPYYVSALAPAVAALSGAGVVSMWQWARRSWAGVVALDVGLVYTGLLAVRLLARTPDFVPWLRTLIGIAVAIAVLGSVALRLPGLLGRRGIAAAAVAGALALTAAPAAYSVANLGRALNGNNVIAGPASAAGGMFGGMRGGSASGDSALISYLEANQGTAKYLVAASGSQTTASIIIATGKPVVTIGGFSGSDNAPTVAQLAAMVKAGELKYVLIGGGGGPGGGSNAISAWVQAHGTAVDSVSTSGTLYAVSA